LAGALALTLTSLAATIAVRPETLRNYYRYPFMFVVPAGVLASLACIWLCNRSSAPLKAFLASCAYLFFMLAGACFGLYPTLLPSSARTGYDITMEKALSGPHTLAVGLVWWMIGMALAVGYIVFVYSRFRGKADAPGH